MRFAVLPLVVCLSFVVPCRLLGVGLPAGTTIQLTATAEYTDGSNSTRSVDPASATMTVTRVAGVVIEADQPDESGEAGQTTFVPLRIANAGNAVDTINLSVRSASGWDVDLVYDENADGIHQPTEEWVITNTGAVVADGYCPCFARVSVPQDAVVNDRVTVTATSQFNSVQGRAAAALDVCPAGKETTALTAQSSAPAPFVGSTVTVTGSIAPAMQATLQVSTTPPSGAPVSSSVSTAADGSFQFSFTPQQEGTHQVHVSFDGNDTHAASSTTVSVDARKTVTSIVLVQTPDSPAVGQTVTVSGLITPALQGSISITRTDPSGSQAQTQVNSSADGRFAYSTTVGAPGNWRVAAAYAGSVGYVSCSKELTIPVSSTASGGHTITFTAGPSASPTGVDSQGQVQCSATAVDSEQHIVNYTWSDGGAGGAFSAAASQNPSYTAPRNTIGRDVTVTLTCTAACSDSPTTSVDSTVTLTVRSAPATPPHVVEATPSDNAVCVSRSASIVVRFDKAMNRQATQAALSVSPALAAPAYSWSADSKTLTVTHNGGLAGQTTYSAAVGTAAKDSNGTNLTAEFRWSFSTASWAAFSPSEVSATPDQEFDTPHIVLYNPSRPTTVSVVIRIPDGFGVDSTTNGGSLACVVPGSATGAFLSEWDPQNREILVTAQISAPGSSVEIVDAITLTAPATAGTYKLGLDGCPALSVRVGGLPGDFNYDEAVNIKDASLFIGSWVKWHQNPAPMFDLLSDGVFDLAPRTDGSWPEWSPLGDNAITIKDATAFIDCWIGSHSSGSTAAASGAGPSLRSLYPQNSIPVVLVAAPGKTFELAVQIPEDAAFDPAIDRTGNLLNVAAGPCAAMLFSEYDRETNSVMLAGEVSGPAPHVVATIHVLRQ